MATLIDTLKAQGRATDYNSRKSLYESMGLNKQYGNYSGSYDQNINFLKAISGGSPSPSAAQGTPSGSPTPPSPSQPTIPSYDLSNLTNLQKQYAQLSTPTETDTARKYKELVAAAPDYGQLYSNYANELGLNKQMELTQGLQKTVMDLEGKIAKIEPMINERAQSFVMTEAQRGRMVNAEERPLRDQYLEAARQKNYADVGLGNIRDLVNTRLQFAQSGYNNQLSGLQALLGIEDKSRERELQSLKDLISFEEKNAEAARKKSESTYDPSQVFFGTPAKTAEPKPPAPPQTDQNLIKILSGGTPTTAPKVTTKKSTITKPMGIIKSYTA